MLQGLEGPMTRYREGLGPRYCIHSSCSTSLNLGLTTYTMYTHLCIYTYVYIYICVHGFNPRIPILVLHLGTISRMAFGTLYHHIRVSGPARRPTTGCNRASARRIREPQNCRSGQPIGSPRFPLKGSFKGDIGP